MSRESSRDRFGPRAEAYVTSADHDAPDELALLVAAADPQPGWLAVDVATGGGHTALAFAPAVARVVATDLTPEMLAAARRLAADRGVPLSFAAAAAERLPFAAGSVDLVTCRIAPHHFEDPFRFVAEAARVLRVGGVLVVQDHVVPDDAAVAGWIDDFERRRDPSHRRALSEPEWRAAFAAAGLAVTSVRVIRKTHDLVVWAERQGAAVEPLRARLLAAPPAVAAWLEPAGLDGEGGTFVNRHVIIAGRLRGNAGS